MVCKRLVKRHGPVSALLFHGLTEKGIDLIRMLLNHCDVGYEARLAPVDAPRLEALPTIERSPAQASMR
jgi:hypothetical protein